MRLQGHRDAEAETGEDGQDPGRPANVGPQGGHGQERQERDDREVFALPEGGRGQHAEDKGPGGGEFPAARCILADQRPQDRARKAEAGDDGEEA